LCRTVSSRLIRADKADTTQQVAVADVPRYRFLMNRPDDIGGAGGRELAQAVELAARIIAKADAVLVAAGAGMGVDSGLPDFRSSAGLWKAYPPAGKLGLSFFELANPEWFHRNPRLAWGFYGHRLNLYRRTDPHEGFFQLHEMVAPKHGGYFVFTSNVDGQFQKANYDEDNIVECHGSVHHLQCTEPCCDDIWDASQLEINIDETLLEATEPLPVCPHCGTLARPNVLMFGDWLWLPGRTKAQETKFFEWLRMLNAERMRLAILEIGAGDVITTVRSATEYLARTHDVSLIRVNPVHHHVPDGHVSIPLGGREGIARIHALVKPHSAG
jgi:NAD-dependent SIR2 family protein deacetylase